MLHVTEIRYLGNARFYVAFDDGTRGEADISDLLEKPVFAALRDEELIARVTIDEDFQVPVWPSGVDLAPEALRARLRSHPA